MLFEFLEAGIRWEPVTTEAADKVELKPETLLAYELHIASIDTDVEQIQPGDQRFLWADAYPEKLAQLRKGTIIAELYSGKRPIQVHKPINNAPKAVSDLRSCHGETLPNGD